jgi:hypothetical protein
VLLAPPAGFEPATHGLGTQFQSIADLGIPQQIHWNSLWAFPYLAPYSGVFPARVREWCAKVGYLRCRSQARRSRCRWVRVKLSAAQAARRLRVRRRDIERCVNEGVIDGWRGAGEIWVEADQLDRLEFDASQKVPDPEAPEGWLTITQWAAREGVAYWVAYRVVRARWVEAVRVGKSWFVEPSSRYVGNPPRADR